MKIQNGLIILGLSAVVVGGIAYSQVFIHEKNRKELREIAREMAYTYKDKLDLTEKQAARMERIIIESTIRKNEILTSRISEVKKIQKLQRVQLKEHRNLKKILDEQEFLEFVKLNKKTPVHITNSFSV